MAGFKENGGGTKEMWNVKTTLGSRSEIMKMLPVWPLSSGWRCGTSGRGEGSPPARRSAPLRPLCTYRTAGGWSTSPASPEDRPKQRNWGKSVRSAPEQKCLKRVEWSHKANCSSRTMWASRWPTMTPEITTQHRHSTAEKSFNSQFTRFSAISGSLHLLPMFVLSHGAHRSLRRLPRAANGYSYGAVYPGQIYRLVKHKCSFFNTAKITRFQVMWSTKYLHFSLFKIIL